VSDHMSVVYSLIFFLWLNNTWSSVSVSSKAQMKGTVFSDVKPCSLVEVYLCVCLLLARLTLQP
jgi:hypothetical protein